VAVAAMAEAAAAGAAVASAAVGAAVSRLTQESEAPDTGSRFLPLTDMAGAPCFSRFLLTALLMMDEPAQKY